MIRSASLAVLLAVFTAAPLLAEEKPGMAFKKAIDELFANHRGKVSAAVELIDTGEAYAWEAERPMPTASLIKLPVMIATYRLADAGEVDLQEAIELKEEDKVPGSGVLTTNFSAGATISLRDAVRLMIAYSDNTATNLVVDQIGLPATREFTAEYGCPETQIHAKVYKRETSIDMPRSIEFGLGSTTASDMVKMLKALDAGTIASPAACEAMIDHLRACEGTSKVRRYLPSEAVVGNKTGSVSDVRTDAGLIESPAGTIAYCVLTSDNEDRSWGNDNEAELLAAEFGRLFYNHFNPSDGPEAAPVARVLRIGADGDLVAALQRTLNSHADEANQIADDGDFGPNTERAVKRFQRAKGLEPTGAVGIETWRALGPLVSEEEAAVVDPAKLNAEPLETAPADPLDGPPIVTAKAYAIADGATGEVLWGKDETVRRDPASVTKLMTAHLVAKAAEADPSILEEVIVASKRAADTSGSSAQLKEGDKVPVKLALYGLMLPSGNDMSVAIAQHFGGRLHPEPDEVANLADPHDAFVAAMNAEAARLGMAKTGYRNPHGLTAEGHQTTAADQVKLVMAARESAVLREVVGTRRLAVTLDSVSGYQRTVIWSNSNRLLRIEGFDGVKTGTTGPAGACLASTGVRDGKRLVVVVLGSSCSDARYTDSRNLYRWAWGELLGGAAE